MTRKPSSKPAIGEVNIGTSTFQSSPLPSHQCSWLGWAQIITRQLSLEAASAEPQRPPISAWLELEGRPNHQVMRFQMIAPSNAQIMISELIETSLVSTRPEEIVLATALPLIPPSRFVQAASR